VSFDQRAIHLQRQQGRDFLSRNVDARSRRLQAIDALVEVAERTGSRSEGTWTRESLHERGA
jgi:hypothetical protein